MRLCGIISRFQLLSPGTGQVSHALLTRPPLSHQFVTPKGSCKDASFDLHVLSTPPAFILSQDRALRFVMFYHNAFFKKFSLESFKVVSLFSYQGSFCSTLSRADFIDDTLFSCICQEVFYFIFSNVSKINSLT